MINDAIVKRITEALLTGDAIENLTSLPNKDFQSLMLYVFEKRLGNWSIPNMFKQYHDSRFTGTSSTPQKTLLHLDKMLYDVIPDFFESIEFSPVVPLGTNSLLANTNQKNVMSTVRNLEVLADPTTALSLECAKRRTEGYAQEIYLATSHRCIRLQNFESIAGFIPHFRIFSLATASKKNGLGNSSGIEMFCKHLSTNLDILLSIASHKNFWLSDIEVLISDIGITEYLANRNAIDRTIIGQHTQNNTFDLFSFLNISAPRTFENFDEKTLNELNSLGLSVYTGRLKELKECIDSHIKPKYPGIKFMYSANRIAGIGYYENFCMKISAKNQLGEKYPLVDGGSTPWLKKLLASKKEHFFISGIGSELLCSKFYLKKSDR